LKSLCYDARSEKHQSMNTCGSAICLVAEKLEED